MRFTAVNRYGMNDTSDAVLPLAVAQWAMLNENPHLTNGMQTHLASEWNDDHGYTFLEIALNSLRKHSNDGSALEQQTATPLLAP